MSLVVAEMHDGGVTIVADTKITVEGDPDRTRRVLQFALPKIVLLDATTAVGYAGPDPERTLRAIVALRGHALAETVASIQELSLQGASFVVASLGPEPRLWKVDSGDAEDRSPIGRAWVGDHAAYETFQQRYHEWPDDVEAAFRLLSSMQFLTSFGVVRSVGGYVTRVSTGEVGFRFVPDQSRVAPWRMSVSEVSIEHESLQVRLSVPPGGDATAYSMLLAVGREPTLGSLAVFVPEALSALLFRHETPGDPVRLEVATMEELVYAAHVEHGQHLVSG